MVMSKQRLKAERTITGHGGFTLIELIMVIVIMGILGVYTFSFLSNTIGAYMKVEGHKILYDEGRQALEYMVLELRDANQNASITTGTSSIAFTRSNPSATSITYSLSGGTLNRVSGGSTNALAGNVTAFTPSVSGSAPNQTVTLNLTISSTGSGTLYFRTTVYPRNIS
jgi:prepilin-type N-terminal cleavage/methylation domain-containing protein